MGYRRLVCGGPRMLSSCEALVEEHMATRTRSLSAISRIAPLSISLVLAVAGLAACSRHEPATDPVRAVRTLVVGGQSGSQAFEFAGEVRARVESKLGFRVPGKITKRMVELGQPVRNGQVLAQMDASDLKLQQDAARAGLSAAQANYDQNVTDLKRFKDLRDQGFISAAEYERRETGLKAALASLNQAKAQSSAQANQTGYAALTADAPGVITYVDAEPGQVVAAGMPVFALAHDGPRDVVFSVPEDRLSWVRTLLNKQGALKVRRWGAATLVPATVREVAAAADPVTRTFAVKATLASGDLTLGQTVTVLVDANGQPGKAVRVPLTALLEKEGKTSVWVLDGQTMKVALQPVQVLSVTADSVLIGTGLRAGQEVVTAGVHVLVPGQEVRRYLASGSSGSATAPPAASSATSAVKGQGA